MQAAVHVAANEQFRYWVAVRFLVGTLGTAMLYRPMLLLLVFSLGTSVFSQAPDTNRAAEKEEATLEELLVSGLKARTAGEKAFIAKVAKTVEEGKLSEALVKALFQRALRQHGRFPLPYFTAMIRLVAKDRGVIL